MYDINGHPLKKGDIINIPCVILEVFDNADACNVNVELIHIMPSYIGQPNEEPGKLTVSCLNTKQTELRLPAELVDAGIGQLDSASARNLQIIEDKNLRVQVDALIETVKQSPFKSAERTLAYRQLQLAKAWLGVDLQELGTANPYPNSE